MKEKKQGPIRFEALIPFSFIVVGIYLYSTLFLDDHLKTVAELGGYHLNGAEVNIGSLKTSFFNASIRIENIELTNPDKPTHNSIVLGDVRFGMLWDALLRGKIVINEVAVEGVAIDVKRKKPGKVKPPPPPSPGDDALTKALIENKSKALGLVANQNEDNVLGGVARILKGDANQQDILTQVQGNLTAEKRIAEINVFLRQKQSDWDTKLANLPKLQDFEKIEKDIAKIQTQNFKNLDEAQNAVNQLQSALKELDAHLQSIENIKRDFIVDSNKIETEVKSIEKDIKADLEQLKSYLSVPKVDLKDIMHSLIMNQIQPYLAKVGYFRSVAQHYMPPNLGKKTNPDEIELALQPRPRSRGITYEFGKVGGYPLFWLKKISLSSKANANLGLGNLSGHIFDITSNQALIQKPTRIEFKGDFPSLELNGVAFNGEFDNRKLESRIEYQFVVGQYPVEEQNLVESDDIKIIMSPAISRFETSGSLINFRDIKLTFKKDVVGVNFRIDSPNIMLKDRLTNVFSDLNEFNFRAEAEGRLPHLAYRFDTDFGRKLGERLGREVARLLEQFKAQAEKEIKAKIETEKEKLITQAKAIKEQIKKQVDTVKLKAEAEKLKIETQKAALENQIKAQANQQLNAEKKKLEVELNKAKDKLKKKFGL